MAATAFGQVQRSDYDDGRVYGVCVIVYLYANEARTYGEANHIYGLGIVAVFN